MWSFRRELIPLTLVLAGWAWLAFIYGDAPARVPSHWGGDGRPDAWADRSFLFSPPAVLTGLYLLMTFLPSFDRDRQRARTLVTGRPFQVIRIGTLLIVLVLNVVTTLQPTPATMQILILGMLASALGVAIYCARAALLRDGVNETGSETGNGNDDR